MPDTREYEVETLRDCMKDAELADPDTPAGARALHGALSRVLGIDTRYIKRSGTSNDQVRLLPRYEELVTRVGVDVRTFRPAVWDAGRLEAPNRTSYAFVAELRKASVENGLHLDIGYGEETYLWAERYIREDDLRYANSKDRERILSNTRAMPDGLRRTLDARFSMPVLKRFVLKICSSYERAL